MTRALILVLGVAVALAGLVDIFVQGQILWGLFVTLVGLSLVSVSQR